MVATHLLPRPMSIEEFLPLVGREFEVDCEPRAAMLTLVEAVPYDGAAMPGRAPFHLIFRSGPKVLLTAAIYAMRSGSFGPELIHISPIVSPLGSPPGYTYQAVFN